MKVVMLGNKSVTQSIIYEIRTVRILSAADVMEVNPNDIKLTI